MWSSDFVNHSHDYRPNWTPLSPVTITNRALKAQVHVSCQRTPYCTYGQITTISTILLEKGFPTWLFSQTKTKNLKTDKAFSTTGLMYVILELNLKQSS